MKQLLRVLEAIEQGARTSVEASAHTSLPVKHCSAWLAELEKMDFVQRIGMIRFAPVGRPAVEYRLVVK